MSDPAHSGGRAHSRVGASSYYRWKACPGSVRLASGMPNESSVYAAEGSVAHEIAEEALRTSCGRGALDPLVGTVREHDGHKITVTTEMLDALWQYVTLVRAELSQALLDDPTLVDDGTPLLVECKFHLRQIHPDAFGTSDAVIHRAARRRLQVFDYKHGAGVLVEAEGNGQGMYYAVGALLELTCAVDDVEIIIVQPRCYSADGPVRRWVVSTLELLEFAQQLRADILATQEPDAPIAAGDHCQFCPAAAICPELRARALAIAQQEFAPVDDATDHAYDPAQLAEALRQLPIIKAWVNRTEDFAYREALRGATPPGYKLVASRPRRLWRDATAAANRLMLSVGLSRKEIYVPPAPPELLSPAQIEKLIGKAVFREEVAEWVEKKSSGLSLVPLADRRPPAQPDAVAEFTSVVDINTETED